MGPPQRAGSPTPFFSVRNEDRETNFFFAGIDDNRNVLQFVTLLAELELLAIVKPGPFVHAEIQLGGLPDYVWAAENLGIHGMLFKSLETFATDIQSKFDLPSLVLDQPKNDG